MRFLIVAAAVFACAAAAPSGALLAAPYAHGLVGATSWGVAAPLAAAPVGVIPAGTIQAAAIDANVVASDHVRAAVDAAGQVNDQVAENHGKAINAAESQAWQAVSNAQTVQAAVDGAAAGITPVVAPAAAYAAPVAAYAAPVAAYAAAAPAVVAPAIAAHGILGAGAIAAPAVYAGSQSISTQSLSQTHPVPVVHAPVAYGVHGIGHGW